MLIVVFTILGAGLALLLYNNSNGRTFGIANDDFASLVQLSAIAALLSVGILAGRRGRMPEVLRNIAIWIMIALALVAGYMYRDEFYRVGTRLTAGLIPGTPMVMTTSEGTQEVVIYRSRNGHFQAKVTVNGQTIPMLVDTGASSIVLSWEDAARLKLSPNSLDYTVSVMTANGRALAAPVSLQSVDIGPIQRDGLRALVAERGKLEQSLLGMSFLSTLGSLQMQTDELILRD